MGAIVGTTAAVAGLLGVTIGGVLADRLRRRFLGGRLYVGLLAAALPVPLALWMLTTESVVLAYVINFPVTFFSAMWIGAGASTVQDLVLPRMRAVASAAYILVLTLVGFALGPYVIGQLSDALGDLAAAMRWSLLVCLLSITFLVLAIRHLEHDEKTMLERARAAGEDT